MTYMDSGRPGRKPRRPKLLCPMQELQAQPVSIGCQTDADLFSPAWRKTISSRVPLFTCTLFPVDAMTVPSVSFEPTALSLRPSTPNTPRLSETNCPFSVSPPNVLGTACGTLDVE